MIKRQWKFLVVLLAGALSAIFDFGLHLQPIFTNFTFMGVTGITYSEILIDIIGIYTAINMAIEMIGDIRRGRWGVDVLAIIAIVSTMIIRNYWAAWMILVMFTGGESLEDYATSQADKELRSLLDNTPRKANKLVNGQISEVDVDDLKIGDHVLIKPAEQVPVDGKILKGDSSFDQSSLTGESVPVAKKPGDELMSDRKSVV